MSGKTAIQRSQQEDFLLMGAHEDIGADQDLIADQRRPTRWLWQEVEKAPQAGEIGLGGGAIDGVARQELVQNRNPGDAGDIEANHSLFTVGTLIPTVAVGEGGIVGVVPFEVDRGQIVEEDREIDLVTFNCPQTHGLPDLLPVGREIVEEAA